MTIGDNNTISASDLNTDLDASRSQINSIRGDTVGYTVQFSMQSITAAAAEVTRQIVFTPQDNWELTSIWVDCDIDSGNSGDLTATLSVASGETEYILDDTVSATVSVSASPAQATSNYAATTATRYVLRKGVPYALTLLSTASFGHVSAAATFKLKRRFT